MINKEDKKPVNEKYSWIAPSNKKVVIKIESIDRLGLLTVAYNQPLEMRHESLIVAYDQLSDELPIDFNWTLVSNTTTQFQVQMSFSMPLSVSAGRVADRVIIYLSYVSPDSNRVTFDKLSNDLPVLIKSAEELESLK